MFAFEPFQSQPELSGKVRPQAEVDRQAAAAVALPHPPNHDNLPRSLDSQRSAARELKNCAVTLGKF